MKCSQRCQQVSVSKSAASWSMRHPRVDTATETQIHFSASWWSLLWRQRDLNFNNSNHQDDVFSPSEQIAQTEFYDILASCTRVLWYLGFLYQQEAGSIFKAFSMQTCAVTWIVDINGKATLFVTSMSSTGMQAVSPYRAVGADI